MVKSVLDAKELFGMPHFVTTSLGVNLSKPPGKEKRTFL
jgi:hypothetical protein